VVHRRFYRHLTYFPRSYSRATPSSPRTIRRNPPGVSGVRQTVTIHFPSLCFADAIPSHPSFLRTSLDAIAFARSSDNPAFPAGGSGPRPCPMQPTEQHNASHAAGLAIACVSFIVRLSGHVAPLSGVPSQRGSCLGQFYLLRGMKERWQCERFRRSMSIVYWRLAAHPKRLSGRGLTSLRTAPKLIFVGQPLWGSVVHEEGKDPVTRSGVTTSDHRELRLSELESLQASREAALLKPVSRYFADLSAPGDHMDRPLFWDEPIEARERARLIHVLNGWIRKLVPNLAILARRPGRRSVETQLRQRSHFSAEAWNKYGPEPRVVALLNIIQRELALPNHNFLPGDPLVLLINSSYGIDDKFAFQELESRCAVKYNDEDFQRMQAEKWTLGDLVADLMERETK
jgi:hypothetical protein